MLSEVLGLTIKKKVLNEDSSKKVVPAHKLLKKAAINYAELSKAANDLNIVRQNIITLVGPKTSDNILGCHVIVDKTGIVNAGNIFWFFTSCT